MSVPPPAPINLPAGAVVAAGLGVATVLPDLDFETKSEAGFVWNPATNKWTCLPGAPGSRKGLQIVGAAVYATHPSTEILSLAYDLKDGRGQRRWKRGDPPPYELFAYIASGGLLEAHNSAFEHWVWQHVAVPKLGWPPLPLAQLRCSMAKAKAFALPGALDDLGSVLQLRHQKDKEGARLIKKFSIPRDPTKNDPRRWITPEEDPADAAKLYDYNGRDIEAESEASSRIPDLPPDELAYWLCDQEINYRGVAVDTVAVADCIAIVEQVFERYNGELARITAGAITQGSQTEKMKDWLRTRQVFMQSMDEEAVDRMLEDPCLAGDCRRVLELRSKVGSASIKKLFTIRNQTSQWGRIHDLINYHQARTGRDGGRDAQTQNLPRTGLDVWKCRRCSHWFGAHTKHCYWCGTDYIPAPDEKPKEWNADVFADAFHILASRDLDTVELFFGDAFSLIIGCLRGLFIAAPGHDMIASDYSSIEGVVTAALAGCGWRLEAYRAGKDMYLVSAANITGIQYEDYIAYGKEHGSKHPDRQRFGKVPELSLGYGGWIGAAKQFGADEYFTDEEIKKLILDWRAASPEIVEFWGGQFRSLPWLSDYRAELFGLEGCAIQAIQNPGKWFTYRAPHPDAQPINYVFYNSALYCLLPSGRYLTYHNAALEPASRGIHDNALSITFWGWNSNPKMGPLGWAKMETYGGKLAENVVQAVSRDIFRDAVVRFRDTIYKVVLRVHDEIVAEVPTGTGDLKEFERIMSVLPAWAASWPVVAKGGWVGERYRKD